MKAVVLVSGGLDSATTLAIAKEEGRDCFALSFDYGQRHRPELDAARRVVERIGVVEWRVIALDLGRLGGSALTDGTIPIPEGADDSKLGAQAPASTIPVTYVPARNTIFLSYALAWAEVLGANAIYIGVNAVDYSGYPDCRPEYIAAYQKLANLATRSGVEGSPITIETPLIAMTKGEIISRGSRLGVDFGLTLSCYQPTEEGLACGRCDSCRLRRKGFLDAGVADPTRYIDRGG